MQSLNDKLGSLHAIASFPSDIPPWLIAANQSLAAVMSESSALNTHLMAEFEALETSQSLLSALENQRCLLTSLLRQIPRELFISTANTPQPQDIQEVENIKSNENLKYTKDSIKAKENQKESNKARVNPTQLDSISDLEFNSIPKYIRTHS